MLRSFDKPESTNEAEAMSMLNPSDEELRAVARNADFTWTKTQISQRANELLGIDTSTIDIPEIIYANAEGAVKNQIKDNYLKRREFLFDLLKQGRSLYKSYDADGNVTFKTVQKVENSRSIGSLQDKHFLRLALKAYKKLGAYFEINTARTGFVPGPSLVGTEGPKFKDKEGNWRNPRAANEISGLLHEFGIHYLDDPENQKLFDQLIINGLSGGARHDPRNGGSLTVSPATIRYGQFIEKLNSIKLADAPNGFLTAIEEVVENKAEHKPLKVFEYKSIPWVFIKHPDFTVRDYVQYITLVERSRKNGTSDQEFFAKLNQSGIKLPLDYYDPTKPPATENELTRQIRLGMVSGLTPHAFDSDNVIRSDKKVDFYRVLSKFAKSPEAQQWAQDTFGIPLGTELFTLNKKSIAHIDFDNFETKYSSLQELIEELKNKGKEPENPDHVLINVVDNDPQPYLEIAPNTSKADVLPGIEEVRAGNHAVIGAGDSPGSDAVMLAQSILLGGGAFITRGLMTESDVALQMVELLSKEQNQWHDDALSAVEAAGDEPSYKSNRTGEIKSKSEWSQTFLDNYSNKIFRSNNIHENNAFNAAIFAEFFAGDKDFNLELDPNAKWAQDVIEDTNKRSLVTPISEAGEKALEGQVYEQCILEKYPLLKKIPIINKVFDPMPAGKTFDGLLSVVSKVLIGAAPIEIIADKMGAGTVAWAAGLAQRLAYATNTVASGISRGLVLSSHKFYWQFVGEIFGLASTFFNETSTFGRTLRAINQTVLIGRANELAMRSNYNLDDFAKDDKTKAQVKEDYSSDAAKPYADKKTVAAKLTKDAMSKIDYWSEEFMGGLLSKIPLGKAAATTAVQFSQAAKMALNFVRIPALRKHTLANFFSWGDKGPTKMSKNSGKAYGEVHEENTYAFAGMATLGTAVLSTVLGKLTGSKAIDTVLTNIANMIPALGIITAGKLVHQDQAGDPRIFTDITKKQQNYSPEKSGKLQMLSGWLMAICGSFMHTKTGAALYNLANGMYFMGIREQLKPGIDDAAVNKKTRYGTYYVNADKPSPARALAQTRMQAA